MKRIRGIPAVFSPVFLAIAIAIAIAAARPCIAAPEPPPQNDESPQAGLLTCWYNSARQYAGADPVQPGAKAGDVVRSEGDGHSWAYTMAAPDGNSCPRTMPAPPIPYRIAASRLGIDVSAPSGLASDQHDNIFVADTGRNRVLMVDHNGGVTVYAGGSAAGYSGDGGPASKAALRNPQGLATDGRDNLYIADTGNGVVRRVDSTGNITTFAGNAHGKSVAPGAPAVSVQIGRPQGVATDRQGDVFIADVQFHRVLKVDPAGKIWLVAGGSTGHSGYGGDGGPAAKALLADPSGLVVDSAGNLYIADSGNSRIRKVDSRGVIHTFAGDGNTSFGGDGGKATQASLSWPASVTVDKAGNVYISDTGHNRIRMVNPVGIIYTIAGTGTPGFSGDGNDATKAMIAGPIGIAIWFDDPIFADRANNKIRALSSQQ
jgi:sugar lactone lactonase YvrE